MNHESHLLIRQVASVALLGLVLARPVFSAEAPPPNYYFTTLAGSPGGPGAANGPVGRAQYNLPTGLAGDAAGNIYVADTANHVIRKITPDGIVSTLAGTVGEQDYVDGTGANARFRSPGSVAVDAAGNVYVSEPASHLIRKITPAGVVSTFAGTNFFSGSTDATGPAARFRAPRGLAVDAAGNVFVADYNNHTIRRITAAGVVSTFAGTAGVQGFGDGTGPAARFSGPWGLSIDFNGNLYVSEYLNHTVRRITPAGVVTTLAGSPGVSGEADGNGTVARFDRPLELAVDLFGNVYVADEGNRAIRRISSGRDVTTIAGLPKLIGDDDGIGQAARFRAPAGLVREVTGNLLVADRASSLLRRVSPSGTVTTFSGLRISSGAANGTGEEAQFRSPQDLTVGADGAVYVVDTFNHAIRKIVRGGDVTTFVGVVQSPGSADGSATTARFSNPEGIARDAAGNLYVADTGNHTIRKVTPAGIVSTFAGSAGQFGSTNATGTAARFRAPTRLAVDAGGNVYVADSQNYTIRQITPAGVVTTLAGSPGLPGLSDNVGPLARFSTLGGIAVDASGNVYVADMGNRSLRRVAPNGAVVTMAGDSPLSGDADGAGPAARFRAPSGLAIDAAGVLFLADETSHTIRRITISQVGTVQTIGGAPLAPGNADGDSSTVRFFLPTGMATDAAGNVYVADTANNMIRWGNTSPPAISSPTTATATVGQPFSYTLTHFGVIGGRVTVDGLPAGFTFNPDTSRITGTPTVPGTFAVSISATNGAGTEFAGITLAIAGGNPNDEVYTFSTLAGSAGVAGATNATGLNAQFRNPPGVAVDAAGTVFVADSANHTIRKITSGGVVTTVAGVAGLAGTTDGTGTAARFNKPHGIAIDRTGNLFVTDRSNHTVRRITPAGVVTTIAGAAGQPGSLNGSGTAARFNFPEGIVVDGTGNLFVADSANHTLRRIATTGAVITYAGAAGSEGTADGARTNARFRSPSGLGIDRFGNLYLADSGAHTVRKVSTSGEVTTLAGFPDNPGDTNGTGDTARFRGPLGIAVDSAGNVFLAEGTNHLIRKVTSGGVVSTLGGAPQSGGAVNGTGATARFREPTGLAVDIAGNLYVADTDNHLVRWGALTTPTLASSPVASGGVGQRFSYAARFSGSLAGPFSATGLPAGLTINSATGLIAGVPTAAGTFAVALNATNGAGTRASTLALTITATPPVLTAQPEDVAVAVGDAAIFSVRAGGSPPLTYQWRRNGVPITGATQATLTVRATSSTEAGSYSVVVTNAQGQVTSTPATLTVNPLSALANLSVRTTLGAGQTLIVGAVVDGGGKEILVRAAGPALNGFGLPGLADPRLEIYTTGTLPIAGNDNWSDGLTAVFTSLGAFPFATGSRDAALIEELAGAFTVQARGSGPGALLVEAYDAGGGVAPRLINLSARNQVGTGDNILIAGFAVAGAGTKQLLIRAIGPALAGFGVTGALADPRLQVFSSSGAVVASNDNWDAGLAATFTQVGAFPLTAGSRDAALLLTVNAGASYTVQVDGVGGGTGEALIEIYEIF